MSGYARQAVVAIRLLVVMTVVTGLAYPALVWGIAKVVPGRANGSLITNSQGVVVGSSLIGQSFNDPKWFWPRPSAAGTAGYDPTSSSGSNLGPENPDLVAAIEKRRAYDAKADGVDPATVPADALTTSASSLDPDISPAYATEQIARVAKARGLTVGQVANVVRQNTAGRILGFMGEPRVNVLELNLALAAFNKAS